MRGLRKGLAKVWVVIIAIVAIAIAAVAIWKAAPGLRGPARAKGPEYLKPPPGVTPKGPAKPGGPQGRTPVGSRLIAMLP